MSSDLESIATPTGAPVVPDAPKMSTWDRIIGVLFSPDETFRDIASKPTFAGVLVLMLVTSLISGILLAPRMQFDSLRTQMAAKNPNLGPDDLDRMVRMAGAFGKVSSYASPLILLIIFAVLAAVLLFAFRLMGGEGTFKQSFAVVTYAMLPRMILGIILTGIVVAKGTVDVNEIPTMVFSNLGFLVDMADHPVLFSLLTTFDLFTIWCVALLIIGFAYVSRFTKAKSATIIISLWLFVTAVKLGFAAMGAAKMRTS